MFLNQTKQNLLLHPDALEPSFFLMISAFEISEFHLEDQDLKNSMLEIGFPSCAIEKDKFIDSQGKQVRTENKESFQAEVRKQWAHLRCCCSHRPSC